MDYTCFLTNPNQLTSCDYFTVSWLSFKCKKCAFYIQKKGLHTKFYVLRKLVFDVCLYIGVVICFCSVSKHEFEITDVPIHKSEEVMEAFCAQDLLAHVQGLWLLGACITHLFQIACKNCSTVLVAKNTWACLLPSRVFSFRLWHSESWHSSSNRIGFK